MCKLSVTVSICFFSFILGVIYLANTDGCRWFFDFIKAIPYGDKLGHFFLFGILTFLVVIASGFRTFALGHLSVYYGVACVSVFILCEEISQHFIPSRSFDLEDLTADTLGIICSTGLAYLVSGNSGVKP